MANETGWWTMMEAEEVRQKGLRERHGGSGFTGKQDAKSFGCISSKQMREENWRRNQLTQVHLEIVSMCMFVCVHHQMTWYSARASHTTLISCTSCTENVSVIGDINISSCSYRGYLFFKLITMKQINTTNISVLSNINRCYHFAMVMSMRSACKICDKIEDCERDWNDKNLMLWIQCTILTGIREVAYMLRSNFLQVS